MATGNELVLGASNPNKGRPSLPSSYFSTLAGSQRTGSARRAKLASVVRPAKRKHAGADVEVTEVASGQREKNVQP